ncbi:small ribosomal subunit Rsm22 family protein [Streptomyces sp. DvalAA-14]|uniref:small ribosomal subunit Rsm22 family protein n=1 Tax=Streptomyces sp. DvalAA-14 TaxID=1839759 RepID=UPI00159F1B13
MEVGVPPGRGRPLRLLLVPTVPLPDDLRAALTDQLQATAPSRAWPQVERLIENYRGATPTAAPILRDDADAAAYAAYRMPATYAAVRAALDALRDRAGAWTPATHLDLGGGTGAATWAVAEAWSDAPAAHSSTVLDWSASALDLGRRLAAHADAPAVRAAAWTRAPLTGGPRLPASDLVTVSYLIGELTPADRAALLDAATAATAGALVVVEPGTPDGYARIIEARDRLIAAGLTVLAPCPHDAACPVTGDDWCHFAARVPRTSLHRQMKGGTLAYEDEKFSYVAAVRPAAVPAAPAGSRVVRHPQIRKGLVLLDLCTRDSGLTRATVTKRHGPLYRAARDTDWGDEWPPSPAFPPPGA